MSNLPGSPLYRIGGRFRLLETIERLGMTSAITRAREQAVQLLATRAPADARILDVACGSGPLLEGLAPALGADSLIVGVDESPALLAQAARRRTSLHRNIRLYRASWPSRLAEAPFDGAICCLGLSVMRSWRNGLLALTATVRPGSPIVIIDWLTSPSDSLIIGSYIRIGSMLAGARPQRPIITAACDMLVDPWVKNWSNGVYLIAGSAPAMQPGSREMWLCEPT
jgi:ubiquinone/menaquinone biosynthesis C-methylase UbiE